MGGRLAIAAVILAVSFAAQAAPPLAPGDIVVAGFPYTWLPGWQPGPCDNAICRVDAALTTVTPISDPIGPVLDIAVEGPRDVAVTVWDTAHPGNVSVVLVDVTTGDVTTLATGIPTFGRASIAAAHGRLFVDGVAGILEIDRSSGAVTVLVPEVWNPSGSVNSGLYGVDAEPGGASLVTASPLDCFPYPTCWEFLRIDLATGTATPFDPDFHEKITAIDVAPAGNRFVYAESGVFGDGLVMRTGPSGSIQYLLGGECSQTTTRGVASDLDGNAIVGADGAEEPCPAIELRRIQPGVGVIGSLDLTFGVSAVDVAPVFLPACSDGLDNDDDGTIDWDGADLALPDPQCNGDPSRAAERSSGGGCGLGAELALLLPALGASVARARQRLG